MEYIYAALMLNSAGKEITEDGITSILGAAGIDVDASRAKALAAALENVDIESAISQAAVAPVAVAAGSAAPAGGAAPAAEEAPVVEEAAEEEEKKEEEESGMAGLGALFG
ncbi:MAG: 50S ribosomal protein P1 [Candidatus Methanogaster sp.]|uniref:50S ribosomal protein P1 n=1 Tax=Candidatus Methanogaster sp. TaxID=3386292 RepID=A0AC61L418_9EURY|nr:MAG: 50S ribosomal protein P1 [ANME-2 cluster archaeon]